MRCAASGVEEGRKEEFVVRKDSSSTQVFRQKLHTITTMQLQHDEHAYITVNSVCWGIDHYPPDAAIDVQTSEIMLSSTGVCSA